MSQSKQYGITRSNEWDIDGDDYLYTPDINTMEFKLHEMVGDDELECGPQVGSVGIHVINLYADEVELSVQMDEQSQELSDFSIHLEKLNHYDRVLVYLTDLKIDEAHRGAKLGHQLINSVSRILVKEILYDFKIIILPSPCDLNIKDEEEYKKAVETGRAALKKYYSKIGFKEIFDKYMYINS